MSSLIYLKTSRAFDVQIHSRALLAAVVFTAVGYRLCRHHE